MRTSRLAIVCLVFAIILAGLAGHLAYNYAHPLSGPNWEGLQWFIGVGIEFAVLTLATVYAAPLIVLGSGVALVEILRDRKRQRGAALAVLAILLTVPVIVGVVIVHHRISAEEEVRKHDEELLRTAGQLATWCIKYFAAHHEYPENLAVLDSWAGQSLVPGRNLDDYSYMVGDISNLMAPLPSPGPTTKTPPKVLVLANERLSDGRYAAGIEYPPGGVAMTAAQLSRELAAIQVFRARHGLRPIP